MPSMSRTAIQHNLALFRSAVTDAGADWRQLSSWVGASESAAPTDLRAAVGTLSRAHRLPYKDLLLFNLFEDQFLPDTCTVAAAVGDAAATGGTLLMKNSDLRGFPQDQDPRNYLGHKEIRVVHAERKPGALSHVGIGAAGSLGCKGGMNEAGVGYATSHARTKDYYRRNPDGETWEVYRSMPRRPGFLARPVGAAMEQARTAREAAHLAVGAWFNAAGIYSPGNVLFCDATEVVVVESHYDELAVEVKRSGEVVARANHFQVMQHLNDDCAPAGRLRYERALGLLVERRGRLTVGDMMNISRDHENGPGPNSICRHGADPGEETTISSTIYACNRENPKDSKLYAVLGKPCRAWHRRALCLSASAGPDDVPEVWQNGTIWKECYSEEPVLHAIELEPAR
jgi:hypothetical protein